MFESCVYVNHGPFAIGSTGQCFRAAGSTEITDATSIELVLPAPGPHSGVFRLGKGFKCQRVAFKGHPLAEIWLIYV
jgi:hypothetical protein